MSTNQNKKKRNNYFMSLALKQAMINLGNTKENPSVGCVIIKNNSLISAGHTSTNGRPHAEYNAITNSKKKLTNSILYVTLEPCTHYGKTPPCVKKIIKSKIKKVFFSIKDPDQRSYNNSSKILKKKNINVNIGMMSNKIKEFYRSYILSRENRLPFVTCKLAASKDLFTINKRKKWITNEYSRGRVHLMRSQHDSIITSSLTIMKDNPLLNCRINGMKMTSPTIIILDNHLKISTKSKVIKNNTIIFYNKFNKRKIKLLKKAGVKTYKATLNDKGDLNLTNVLMKVKKLGFYRIFLESGITLASSFLKENLVNDLKIYISDNKLNNNGTGNINRLIKFFLKKKKYTIEKVNLFGDKLISYKIK
tara:strand:+ start:26 stop:1117 length:1092 start_codon:yes stop_codon:yes gene_type:complete